jgi:peptide/nickel transport system substrate-binding protein
MLGRRAFSTGAAAAALTFSSGRLAAAQASSKILRVVPQAEPQSFDPVFTQVNNVSMHGAMIYDQLFGWDDKMNVQPQMVDDWKTTDDRLLYTITLRRGLKFHDGGDVTTRDVVASLKRMFVRDGQNQLLAGLIDEYQRIDDRRFSIRLKATLRLYRISAGREQRRGRCDHARKRRDDRSVHAGERTHRVRPIPFH